jgi:polysaccharide pyruvyl transferase WcaK-like protein
LKSDHPDVEVRCITIAPHEVIARYGVPSMPLAWRSSILGRSRVTAPFAKLIGRLLDMPRSYILAGSVDAVIVPGMGVLEETLGVRPWGLPFALYLMAAACRMRSRRFVLLDVGAEWALNPITRRLYVATVGRATHVSYRDRSSAAAMARAGARDPEAIAPDLAFAHPAPTLARPEPARIVVGVMAYYGLRDDPIRGADVRRRYVASLADAVAQFAAAGDQVVLVGGDRVDLEVAGDVRAGALAARAGLPDDQILVRETTTFTDLTNEMMRADIVIASRFHNLICALRLARPTISVGYAKKNRQLMRALGLHDYCQDIEQLDATRLVAQVRSARTDSDVLAARIRHGTSNFAVEVDCLLDQVASEALGLATLRKRLQIDDEIGIWQNT